MKKLITLLAVFLLLPTFDLWGEMGRSAGAPVARSSAPRTAPSRQSRPASRSSQPSRGPVAINISHGYSGANNRNFPSRSNVSNRASTFQRPTYGQLWNNNTRTAPRNSLPAGTLQGVSSFQPVSRANVQSYAQAGRRASVVLHHHPYTPGYVRQKLVKLGVTAEPGLITDRSQIIDTDKNHSTIRYPQKGLDHQPITATAVSVRQFNDPAVRNQMMIIDSPEWQGRADQYNTSEDQAGHYYWHNTVGVTFCHYLDSSGYNWYGWYVGAQYFWVRNFDGRWWWYDSDYSRWCFWNNGSWWWQDPNHVGDLYYYDDDAYIPCNSADDQVVVTASNNDPMQSIVSPDGTRIVKLDQTTQDAFLYDATNPPTFSPVYLATGVESVQFSNAQNGRVMEILVKLNDGSFDLFDSQGNAYNPGSLDENEAKQGDAPPTP